jgi:hypothetical protein
MKSELTYCTNIHPGESWADVMANLNGHALAVKAAVSADEKFPLGLRISYQAASEITPADIADFRRWCDVHDCYLLTINGFPFGTFHNQPVKEKVYEPDWRSRARVDYTKRLADLAVALSTRTAPLSISTVPVAYKPVFSEADWPIVYQHIVEVLQHLQHIHQMTGITIRLAFEPEPCCVLETIDETVDFFAQLALPENLTPFVGICFDACHQAVEFEDPAQCLQKLAQADITIAKVQVSSALRARGDEISALLEFDEPVYLHQAVVRQGADQPLHRFTDLPTLSAFLDRAPQPEECRVHFHVPIFIDHLGVCGTTRFFLEQLLPLLSPDIPLEVETYSFKALPEHLRSGTLEESICRELQWVQTQLGK